MLSVPTPALIMGNSVIPHQSDALFSFSFSYFAARTMIAFQFEYHKLCFKHEQLGITHAL